MMKKTLALLAVSTMLMVLTGCGKEHPDSYVHITTSSGIATIVRTFSDANTDSDLSSGLETAVQHPYTFYLNKDEIANVHFICDICEYDETIELVSPSSSVLSCNCDKTKHYYKSYIAINLTFSEKSTTE